MAHFACCKTKPIPAYYICENCLNIYHRACALKNKNNLKFVGDHKIQCCDLSKQTDEEISLLEQTIHELNEEIQAKNKNIEKQNKDMKVLLQEAFGQEEETNRLIETLEKELVEAKSRITELTRIINSAINKDKITIAVQTNCIKHMSKDTQTTSTGTFCNIPQSYESAISCKHGNTDKMPKLRNNSKILIVAASIGRNLAEVISRLTNEYQCQGIIKPGAMDVEILKTALINTKSFTKKDIVIIWTNELHVQIIDDFILKLKHTNPIILTKPYQYSGNEIENYRIYQDNIQFFKNLRARNIHLKHVIECNAVLRRSNYSARGQYIRNIGKMFIAKKIINHIKNHFAREGSKHEESGENVGISVGYRSIEDHEQKLSVAQDGTIKHHQLYPKQQEIDLLVRKDGEKETTFLYPRLSEVAPIL